MKIEYSRLNKCPRSSCGDFLIIKSLIAECARCDYKDTWENYNDLMAKRKGFRSFNMKDILEKYFNPKEHRKIIEEAARRAAEDQKKLSRRYRNNFNK